MVLSSASADKDEVIHMPADQKLSVIMQDEHFEIERFPIAMAAGWKLLVDGTPAALIEESVVFHSEGHVLAYIAKQKPKWEMCDRCTDPMDCGSWACCISPATHYRRPGVEIDPKAADIRIEVDDKGVYIGFFTEDGRSAILDLDAISRGDYGSFPESSTLAAWVADRRKQAAAVAG